MGRSRMIACEKPGETRLCEVVEDYIGRAATFVFDAAPNVLIDFAAPCSDPARRARPEYVRPPGVYHDERFIEVWLIPDGIEVTTRSQDPFVNAVADGLARTIAWIFDGEVRP